MRMVAEGGQILALPSQELLKMMANGQVNAREDFLQPASIDLSITDEIYRVKGTSLPQPGESVAAMVKRELLYAADLKRPLEKNAIYFIKLAEKLKLDPTVFALASSKSSTGRLDLQTRLVVDGYARFDRVPWGYRGDLWLQIIPKSFLIKLNVGDRLNQIRFFANAFPAQTDLSVMQTTNRVLFDQNNREILQDRADAAENAVVMNIDLAGDGVGSVIGYKALRNDEVVDFRKVNYYDARYFFEPIYANADQSLLLEKESFYIFCTKEQISVPRAWAAEMAAYDIYSGEFRSHYAGFFDPGFGYGAQGEIMGRQAVLEVRSFDNNLIVRDGQPICKMVFEKLTDAAEIYYGEKIGSHYASQSGPQLSKHFQS